MMRQTVRVSAEITWFSFMANYGLLKGDDEYSTYVVEPNLMCTGLQPVTEGLCYMEL
jgi:hypothetical protein